MSEKVYSLRIDEDLFEHVKKSAEKNKRSIAKEIEFVLENFYILNPNYGETIRMEEEDLVKLMEILKRTNFYEVVEKLKKNFKNVKK